MPFQQVHSDKDREEEVCPTGRDCARVSSCTLYKASLTVEAALAFPLFLLAFLALICMMDLPRAQALANLKLANQAKQAAVYAYALGDNNLTEWIDLTRSETYSFPVSAIPLPNVRLALHARVHAWTGYDRAGADNEEEAEEMVYVTENEGVYHTKATCTHLMLSVHAVTGGDVSGLRNEYGAKYHACEHCHPAASETVYITDKGDRYHSQASCSGLKRMVRMVKKSEVAHLNCCQRCQGGT